MKEKLLTLLLLISTSVLAQKQLGYTVQAGDTIESIAKVYRVSPTDLISQNPQIKDEVVAGQMLVIPTPDAKYFNTQQPQGFKKHTVTENETLYGLSDRYEITQDDLRRYNQVLYNQPLKKGQIITIPLYAKEEGLVTKGKEGLVKYVVKPKEGKWRIAQNFGISLQELERINPNLPKVLQQGAEIWVPEGRTGLPETTVQGNLILYQVEKGEGFMSLERKFGLTQKQLTDLNPGLATGIKQEDQIWIPKENFVQFVEEETGIQTEIDNAYIRGNNKQNNVRNISLVLPFNVQKIGAQNISELKNKLQSDKFTSIATDFYSGVLMAVDTLQRRGYSFKLNVYDSQNVLQGLNENDWKEIKESQAVIGPFLPSEFNKFASLVAGARTALLAPLSSKNIDLKNNVLQTVPTAEEQQEKMIAFMGKKYPDANILIFTDNKNEAAKQKILFAFPHAKVVDNINAINKAMDKKATNIVFVASDDVVFLTDIIRVLYNLTEMAVQAPSDKPRPASYNIIMATLNRGDAYEHSSISNTQLSSLKFTYPSTNKTNGGNGGFIRKYTSLYKISPSKYAMRGFDMLMDVVLRTGVSGNFFDTVNTGNESFYFENKFQYTKTPQGGYVNKGVYILRYENLEIKELH